MKKMIAATTLTVGLAIALTACVGTDTVVKVGKEKITKDVVYVDLMNQYGKEYLNQKIDFMLLNQEATVSEKEMNAAVNGLKEVNKAKNLEELAKKLSTQEDKLLDDLKIKLLEEKVLAKKANLKEKDIKQRYEESKYKVSLNYMPFDNKDTADKALNLVKKGETLENATHKVKEDYYLSFVWNNEVTEGSLPENVLMSIMNLEEGKVSEVIKGEDGRHYLYEVKGRNVYPYSQEKGRIITELATEKGVSINEVYSGLREKYDVESKDETAKELLDEK